MYRDWDGCTYTREEVEEAYRDEVREAIHYGEPYCSWEEYLETFDEVEEEEELEEWERAGYFSEKEYIEDMMVQIWVDAWKNGDFDRR